MEQRSAKRTKIAHYFVEETAENVSAKRQDHETPHTRTARNESQAQLTKLPAEIRQIIWRMLLGDRVLHIFIRYKTSYDHNGKYVSNGTPCIASACRQEADLTQVYNTWTQATKEPDSSNWKVGHPTAVSHYLCHRPAHLLPAANAGFEQVRENQLHHIHDFQAGLGILRACKVVAEEAKTIMWRTNIFAFAQGEEVQKFIKTCTISQQVLLQRLQLRIDVTTEPWRAVYWNVRLPQCDLDRLKNLSELHVHLLTAKIRAKEEEVNKNMDAASIWINNFSNTKLDKVTIIIDDSTSLSRSPKHIEKLSLQQRQQWAARLRHQLLHGVNKSRKTVQGVSWV